MFPSFELFGRTIGTYAVAAILGMFAAGIYACRAAKARGYDDNDMIVLLLVAGVSGLVGSHLFYGIVNFRYIAAFFENFRNIAALEQLKNWLIAMFGGSVYYGGLMAGALGGYAYARRKGLDAAAWSDMVAPAVPLFHAFGRVGCFLSGCCYGIECSWGVTYSNALVEAANGVRRLPVQLIEAAVELALFFLLRWLYTKDKLSGRLLAAYFLIYAVARLLLEFLRGDEARGILLGLSTSQWISILILAAFCIRALLRFKTKAKLD